MADVNSPNPPPVNPASPNPITIQGTTNVFGGGSYASLMYPSDLNQNYYTNIQFVRYSRPTAASDSTATAQLIGGSINLPLPMQILETYNVEWNAVGLGNLLYNFGDAGVAAVQQVIESFKQGSGIIGGSLNALGSIKDQAWGAGANIYHWMQQPGITAEEVLKKMYALIPQSFIDAGFGLPIGAFLGQKFGFVPNPHLAAVFQNVQLRSIPLTWYMSPRNQQESQTLETIINVIRTRAHPKLDFGGYFLDYPDQLFVQFTPSTYILPTKRCVITSFSVDKTPSQNLTWYTGGAPSLVKMELHLSEVEIRTQSDFANTAFPAPM